MTKARILIVEDEGIVSQDIETCLQSMGYEICASVSSGEEAVAKAEEVRPDLVLMDIYLKGKMSGVEAAAKIRERQGLPVIYLTAYTDEETRKLAKVTEPYGYVLKPFDEKDLNITLEMALYRYGMEKRVRESQEWLSTILRSIGDAVIASDAQGRITFMNPVAESLTGWKQEEATGRPLPEVFHTVQERPAEELAGGPWAKKNLQAAIYETLIARDGTRTPIRQSSAPIREEGGKTLGTVIAFSDMSEQRRAEETLANQALELARSNAELEQFAYVASHDLQEPLRMVRSFVQLLQRRCEGKLDADAEEYIGYALDGAVRMRELINALLTYSRLDKQGKSFEAVDCGAVLEKALFNLKVTVEESGAVIAHGPLPTVLGDELQLLQLFQNLIGNAIKFRGSAPPSVQITADQQDREWVFQFKDNGIGIAPEFYERIFLVFQRLHSRESYPGTGIGLAICKKIVERHKGRIWVESEIGKGSTFSFTIPTEAKRKEDSDYGAGGATHSGRGKKD